MDSTQNTQRQNEDRPTPVQFEDYQGTALGESVQLTPGVIGPVLSDLTGGVGNTATLHLSGITQEASIDSLTAGNINITLTFSDATTLIIIVSAASIITAADTAGDGGLNNAEFPLTGLEIDWPSITGKVITNSSVACTVDFASSACALELFEPLASNITATITIDTNEYPLGLCLLSEGYTGYQTPDALVTEAAAPYLSLTVQLYTNRQDETLTVDLSASSIQSFADAPTLASQSGAVTMLLDTLLATLPPIAPYQKWTVNSVDYHFAASYGPLSLLSPANLDVRLLSHTAGEEIEVVTIGLNPWTAEDGSADTVPGGLAVANGDSVYLLFSLYPVTTLGLYHAYSVPQALNNRSLHAIQFFADTDAETDYSQPSYDVEYSLDGVHWQIAYLALSMLGLTVGNGVQFRNATYYSVLFSPGIPGILAALPSPTMEVAICAKYVRYHIYIGDEADNPTPPITALQMAREG